MKNVILLNFVFEVQIIVYAWGNVLSNLTLNSVKKMSIQVKQWSLVSCQQFELFSWESIVSWLIL